MNDSIDSSLLLSLSHFPKDNLDEREIAAFRSAAQRCRGWILTMTTAANSGHPAGSMSSIEMYLMSYAVSDVRRDNVESIERDFIVISHGHTAPAAYSTLAYLGFFDPSMLLGNFRRTGSPFQGHVERSVWGIDWASGNLGQGLAAGVGYALAQRKRQSDGHVFVLMGDGEQTKGQVAEARRIAFKEALNNITALIDFNRIQISGKVHEVMPANYKKLWEADGWQVYECDGHDPADMYSVMKKAYEDEKPSVVFCNTVMGKGVSFMENIPDYHGKALSKEEYLKAMAELGEDPSLLEEALAARKGPLPKGRTVNPRTPEIYTGLPISYPSDAKVDNRTAFGKALADIGRLNRERSSTPILVFDCDLASSVKVDEFAKECPEWFVEAGIQEHATATVAGAASCGGAMSVWADFGVFGLTEVYNQQRLNDINRTNLKLFLTHVGLDVGEDGMTHQCIDYVGLLRNLFGWKLIVPADPNQTDRVTRWALQQEGNICVAMGRSRLPVLTRKDGLTPFYADDYAFNYGKIDIVRQGHDMSIFAMGHMVHRALKVGEMLAKRGISLCVYSVSCPLALEEDVLVEAAKRGPIFTYEDHNVNSGLGREITSKLQALNLSVKVRSFGVSRYGDSGSSDEVFEAMGLAPEEVAEAVCCSLRK